MMYLKKLMLVGHYPTCWATCSGTDSRGREVNMRLFYSTGAVQSLQIVSFNGERDPSSDKDIHAVRLG